MDNTAPRKKLTEAQALEILNSTETQQEIAKKYNIQQPMVSDIKSGRRWKHLQPDKVYTPKKRQPKVSTSPVVITDDQIRKYDPMIKKMVNEHVLRYWAGGNSCASLDPRSTIGRLGKSVEDLIQDGRIFVLQQLRWFQKNGRIGAGSAKESSLMFMHLRRKFISLSRSLSSERHGGQIIRVDHQRKILGDLQNRIPDDMSLDEAMKILNESIADMNKSAQKSLMSRIIDVEGDRKVQSTQQLRSIIHDRLIDATSMSYVSIEDAGETATVDDMTPEIYAMIHERADVRYELAQPPQARRVRKHYGGKSSRLRIFQLAMEKGLPSTHCELARHLGRSPSALSNILHNISDGTPKFRQLLLETFGEPLDELRKSVDVNS